MRREKQIEISGTTPDLGYSQPCGAEIGIASHLARLPLTNELRLSDEKRID